jgi:integrase
MKLRNRLEMLLDLAAVRGWRDRERANPARWKGHLALLLASPDRVTPPSHRPALPWQQAPQFWTRLCGRTETAAAALRFLILTAGRSGEVRGARWEEIEIDAGLWMVPAERMKGRTPHIVPLSSAAVAELRAADRARRSDLIFPGPRLVRPLSDAALIALLRRMGEDRQVPHGWRSTFRDWCADHGHPRDLAEASLAHAVGGVEGHYLRSTMTERRRPLMQQWSDFLAGATKQARRRASA